MEATQYKRESNSSLKIRLCRVGVVIRKSLEDYKHLKLCGRERNGNKTRKYSRKGWGRSFSFLPEAEGK